MDVSSNITFFYHVIVFSSDYNPIQKKIQKEIPNIYKNYRLQKKFQC